MDKNHCNMHLLTPAGSNKKLGARDPFVKLVIDQEGVKFVSFKKKKNPTQSQPITEVLVFVQCRKDLCGPGRCRQVPFTSFPIFFFIKP